MSFIKGVSMPKSAKHKLLSAACLMAALGFSSVSVAAGLKYDELTTGPVPTSTF